MTTGLKGRIAAVLAVMLFAGNLLAALSTHVRANQPGTFIDAVLGELVLCRSHAGGKPEAPADEQRRGGGGECCPLCGSPAVPASEPSAAVVLAPLTLPGSIAWRELGLPTLAEHLLRGGIHGRGPPARA